ncbi:SDR family NAD(P)-dependent oxidoreductase [Sphingopyxis fribergensis]
MEQEHPLRFDRKRVLVIGGTSGIGLGIARAFAQSGATVAVTGTRTPDAYDAEVAALDPGQLDLADTAAIGRYGEKWRNRPLDILVNAAGLTRYGQAEFEPEIFDDVLDVNLRGAFHIAAVLRDNLAAAAAVGGDASIIHIASLASFRATPNNPAYSASKGGLNMLTRSLAARWGRDRIRVNAIAPGFVNTKLTSVTHDDAALRFNVEKRTPLGRWGTPDDVAGCALWLASPLAAFVTGILVPVDGGYSLAL